MDKVVRAVDVGSGNVKYVTAARGAEIECASFPSIAYGSSGPTPSWPAGERLRTMSIPVGPMYYEVGPDVALVRDGYRARHLHDGYAETPEYLALLRGALRMMKVPRIHLLVMGLPVNLFRQGKRALEKLAIGEHDLGDHHKVVVERAATVPQPQGALVHYASMADKMETIGKEVSLVVDPGMRTFDWAYCEGMRMLTKLSGSERRGMADIAISIARDLSNQLRRPYEDLDTIDLALRTGKAPVIYQQEINLDRHLRVAQQVADGAVASMRQAVGEQGRIRNIVLTGGGAPFYRKALKKAFHLHRIEELKDPLFANVRGFQMAGQNMVREEGDEAGAVREASSEAAS